MDRLLNFFGVERDRGEPPADVFPNGLAPFIRLAEEGSGNKVVTDGALGLLPHFAKELAYGRRTYNARSETVATLPSFRDAYTRWRGLNGQTLYSFTMLTVNADGHPVMQRFHRPEDEKRMVVIVHPTDHDDWLACSVANAPRFFNRWSEQLADGGFAARECSARDQRKGDPAARPGRRPGSYFETRFYDSLGRRSRRTIAPADPPPSDLAGARPSSQRAD